FMNIHAALRRYGVAAPIYVAQATICNSPRHEVIRAAQRSVVNPKLGILSGPDSDTIGPEHRYDGCHMAESGLIRHAELWVEALTANRRAEFLPDKIPGRANELIQLRKIGELGSFCGNWVRSARSRIGFVLRNRK